MLAQTQEIRTTEYEPNQTPAALDRKAQQSAQDHLDADAGWALMHQLEAKWYEQGYTAGMFGMDPNDAGLWSREHQAGYTAALSHRRPQFVNVAGLPALYRSEAAQ